MNKEYEGCSSLTSIEIPNSVTRLGKSAFRGCSSLKSLTIGNGVTNINYYIWENCSSLSSIISLSSTPPNCFSSNSFNGVDKSIPLYVPKNSVSAYQTAYAWSEFTNIQEFDYVVDTLLYTGFNTDVLADGSTVDWATGDIIAAGKKDESVQGAGWIVGGGPNGQRMNNQKGTCAPTDSTFTQNYAPYSAEDFGCTPNALTWLKSSNGGYLITPEPVGACEISMWLCMAKSESRKEYLEVAYSVDKSEWTVMDTILVDTFKKFKRHNLTYSGDESVYFKFTSVSTNGSNNNLLMSTLMFHNTEFVVDDLKVAYIYDATYSTYCGIDNDPIFQQSLQNYNATAIDVAGKTVADITLDSLQKTYDVVVLAEAISSGHAYAKAMVDLVNRVPMLNLKSYMYKNSVWNWGAGANPSPKENSVKVNPDFYESPLFANIGTDLVESEGALQLFAADPADKNNIQGYTANEGSLIANDPVIATVGSYNAIHQHGEKNAYILIPISSDDMVRDGEVNLTEDAFILINNAVTYLAMTKTDIDYDVEFSISSAGYATLYSDKALQLPEGVTAYYGKMSADNEWLNLYELADGKIPANTGVVLRGEEGTYGAWYLDEAPAAISGNALFGYTQDIPTSVITSIGFDVYTLAQEDGVVGFYKYNGETLKAGKAFLRLDRSIAQTPKMRIMGSETGISEIDRESAADAPVIYDLQGRRVSDMSRKGIYVVEGKKVIVK